MNRIIFKTDEGGVAVIIPTPEALASYTIEEIAEKDVPEGKPFKIVTDADIPADRTFRDAWEVDEATLTDGTGGQYDVFVTDPSHPAYVEPIKGEIA